MTESSIFADPMVRELAQGFVDRVESFQQWAAKHFDLDSKPFDEKKRITSALRRLVPDGIATSIIWTANMRALRHVLELRTSRHAEEEIRKVFDTVGQIAVTRYPNIFQDFARNDQGEWTPTYSKV